MSKLTWKKNCKDNKPHIEFYLHKAQRQSCCVQGHVFRWENHNKNNFLSNCYESQIITP